MTESCAYCLTCSFRPPCILALKLLLLLLPGVAATVAAVNAIAAAIASAAGVPAVVVASAAIAGAPVIGAAAAANAAAAFAAPGAPAHLRLAVPWIFDYTAKLI
jgi:hypothetical protein